MTRRTGAWVLRTVGNEVSTNATDVYHSERAHTFSSSMALLALARSSSAILASSSPSRENLRFSPLLLSSILFSSPFPVLAVDSLLCNVRSRFSLPLSLLIDNPACVSSNSLIALSCASASLLACSSAASLSSCSRSFSARLISFFCARMFVRAHSRQKISP